MNLMSETSDWRRFALTVGELRERLADLPADMPVILEKDAEGNGYSPLSNVVKGWRYHPDSTYSGEVTSGDECEDDEDEVIVDCDHAECRHGTGVESVILGPVN